MDDATDGLLLLLVLLLALLLAEPDGKSGDDDGAATEGPDERPVVPAEPEPSTDAEQALSRVASAAIAPATRTAAPNVHSPARPVRAA